MKPLCVDLFCGLGGWSEGFLAEGYDVIGYDIERHVYGDQFYPGVLIQQSVLDFCPRLQAMRVILFRPRKAKK